jgi:hypothetical protein
MGNQKNVKKSQVERHQDAKVWWAMKATKTTIKMVKYVLASFYMLL